MTDQQGDPELWARVLALHDYCRRRSIELVTAARPLGEKGVIVSRIGSNASIIEMLDAIRTSLSAEGSDTVHH